MEEFCYNHYLENLEKALYERLLKLIEENRYGEAQQVVSLLKEVGIV